MKEKNSKKLMMFEKVVTAMDNHLKTWVGIPEISRTYDEFVKNYKKLTDLRLEEDNDLRPFVDMYMSKRKQLVSSVGPVASVVSVYAADQKNTKLESRTNIGAEEIEKLKDKQLTKLTDEVIEALSPPKSASKKKKKGSKTSVKSVTEYGLTPEMIEELELARKALVEAKKSMKDAEQFKMKCAKDIVRISKKNNKLLKSRLDRLVNLFREKDKAFFNDYQVAREKKTTAAPKQKNASVAKPKSNTAPKPKTAAKPKSGAVNTTGTKTGTASRTRSTGAAKSSAASVRKPASSRPSGGTKK